MKPSSCESPTGGERWYTTASMRPSPTMLTTAPGTHMMHDCVPPAWKTRTNCTHTRSARQRDVRRTRQRQFTSSERW
jgi:hypothetical protein